MSAYIRGESATIEAAIARASALLRKSRRPLITGLAVDMAAGRAAIRLAERLGGMVDHAAGGPYLRTLRVLQDTGLMFTTPAEAARRADVLVIAGPGAAGAPAVRHVASTPPDADLVPAGRRRIVRLCTAARRAGELHDRLSLLSALLRGNPVEGNDVALKALKPVARAMTGARFGVMAWSARDIDEVGIELAAGIVARLNDKTRFTALPVAGDDTAAGIAQLMGWSSGFPYRTGFGRGYPEHDAWRFDGARAIRAGECDAILWTATLGGRDADIPGRQPVIAIVAPATRCSRRPDVLIEAAVPGVDHDGAAYDQLAGGIVALPATAPDRTVPPAADIIAAIDRRIGQS